MLSRLYVPKLSPTTRDRLATAAETVFVYAVATFLAAILVLYFVPEEVLR